MRVRDVFKATVFFTARCLAWSHTAGSDLNSTLERSDCTIVACMSATQALEREWNVVKKSVQDCAAMSIDCETDQRVCIDLDVASFPAIRLYSGDRQIKRYRGPRAAKEIVAFVNRLQRPIISKLDEASMASFTAVDDVVFIQQEQTTDESFSDHYFATAQQYHDRYSFGAGQMSPPTIMLSCYNNVNDEQLFLSDIAVWGSLDRFITQCSRPLIPEFTVKNEYEYLAMGKSLVHYFYGSKDEQERYVKAILPLARNYKEYLLFTTISAHDYPQMATALGIRPGSTDILSVQSPHNGDVFPYTRNDPITVENVDKFLKDIIGGMVTKWDRTERNMGGIGVKHDEL